MRRLWINGLAAMLLVGSIWLLWNQQHIANVGDAVRLASSQIRRLNIHFISQPRPSRTTIRVATFNIQAFGPDKLQNEAVAQCLAHIARQFDVIAIQEVRGTDSSVLTSFVDIVNSTGRNFATVAGEPIAQNRYTERCAFLFDTDSVCLDGSHSYSVADPDNVLTRKPFVGWFRTLASEPTRAFTFNLVNVHLDSRQSLREVGYLAQLFRAIRADGRGEDDIIIAGDFNAEPEQWQLLRERLGLACLITSTPTNVRSTCRYDNLLINPLATTEFTGQCGVCDFLKGFNLTIDQAMAISDHLPVWAEFSVVEGFSGNLTASRQAPGVQ